MKGKRGGWVRRSGWVVVVWCGVWVCVVLGRCGGLGRVRWMNKRGVERMGTNLLCADCCDGTVLKR